MTGDVIRVLGICGSLRKGSFNRKILQVADDLKPSGMEMQHFDLGELPLYNQDLVSERYPEPIERWREAVRNADALLVACPEYNYSVTGALKNALDWGSRPEPGQKSGSPFPLRGKPTAVMGVGGRSGTARSQLHFRQIAVYLDMPVMLRPEVYIANSPQSAFDAQGNLTNETSRQLIQELVNNLASWARRFREPLPEA